MIISEVLWDCKLKDLRRTFQGVNGSSKVKIYGTQDIKVEMGDDDVINITPAFTLKKNVDVDEGIKESMRRRTELLKEKYSINKSNDKDFEIDLNSLLAKHNTDYYGLCRLLMSKKEYRKYIKDTFRKLKKARSLAKTLNATMRKNKLSFPDLGKLVQISIPIDLPKSSKDDREARQLFADECRDFYEKHGYVIYGVEIKKNHIELIGERKK